MHQPGIAVGARGKRETTGMRQAREVFWRLEQHSERKPSRWAVVGSGGQWANWMKRGGLADQTPTGFQGSRQGLCTLIGSKGHGPSPNPRPTPAIVARWSIPKRGQEALCGSPG